MTKIEDLFKYYKPKTDEWLSQEDLCMAATQNTVSTVDLGCTVPLKDIVKKSGFQGLIKSKLSVATFRFAPLRSKHFSSQRKNLPRVPTIQLFERGQAVIVGAISEDMALLYCHILRIYLLNIGIRVRCNKLVMCNRVCSGYYPYGIDTASIGKRNKVTSVKDGGEFPGVMVVIGEFKLTLFPTGKFIVMGMYKKEDRIKFLKVIPIFERHKLHSTKMVSKAQRGSEVISRIMRKRNYTDISALSKKQLMDLAMEAINEVDFGSDDDA